MTKAAKDKGYTNIITFLDDGVSGVTMDRPGFNEMMAELEKGYIGAVFVKDLSRLGRNYIEVGRLTEEFFPDHDIRLVAVSDGVDTAEGENELTPIKNLFNEWYARDISKKRRISNKVKGNSGEPLSPPPYGYMKDPENPKRWIIDPEPAAVVRQIYTLTLDGKGITQIANILEEQDVKTPMHYWYSKGLPRGGVKNPQNTRWSFASVDKILRLQEYCGDVINFKTYSKSYKNKRRLKNNAENMAVFKDVHEPVIDRATWESVQAKRENTRKRPASDGEKNIFSGLLFCADCGSKLNYHFNQGNHDIKYFNCCNNNSGRKHKDCATTHYVRVDFIGQVVLNEIRRLTKFASHYEDDFIELVIGHSKQTAEFHKQVKQKDLNTLIARDKEIDRLFNSMFEACETGKIDDARFAKMSKQYTEEQSEILERIKVLKRELDAMADKAVTTDMFVKTVRKYTRAKTLTEQMLNELIDKIEIYHAERENGVNKQQVRIHYACVGSIEIPDYPKLPKTEVTVHTRQGVATTYEPPYKIAI